MKIFQGFKHKMASPKVIRNLSIIFLVVGAIKFVDLLIFFPADNWQVFRSFSSVVFYLGPGIYFYVIYSGMSGDKWNKLIRRFKAFIGKG